MGHKKNRLNRADGAGRGADEGAGGTEPGPAARPRLGLPDDSWSAVWKDVVREAPTTALTIAGATLLAVLHMVAYLVQVLASWPR
jgi:hypothetical protein